MGGEQLRVGELDELAVKDAWAAYLAATRGQPPARYTEVEPWAWKRLQAKLAAIAAKEAA